MIRKLLKSNKKLYFLIYPLYLKIKGFRNRSKNKIHYENFYNSLNKSLDKKKVFYVGIPIHSNLGDLAQYYCIKKWIANNYPDYDVVEIVDSIILINYKNVLGKIKKVVSNDDIFVFQSGYRTTDVANYEGECTHRIILKNFDNKVVVFPQTINFGNNNESSKSSSAYKANNNYTFLARDSISFETAKKLYDSNKVYLFPDIVTTLIGSRNYNDNKNGILLCLRNDGEKLYSEEEYNQVINKLKNISDTIDVTDTNSKLNYEFDKSMVEKEVIDKINQFSNYKVIITDRYHGTIFSLISNTYVIVLNSTDHKLSSGVNWFKGVYDNSLCYCDSLDNLYNIVERIYNDNNKIKNKPYFKENYYDKLKSIIDRSE